MFSYLSGDDVRKGDRVENAGRLGVVTFIDADGTFSPELGAGFMIREETGIEIFVTDVEPCLTLVARGDG